MSRLTQFIQNLFIRLEGLLNQFFGTIFGGLNQFFSFLGQLLGFTNPQDYLEDEVQSLKRTEEKPTKSLQDVPSTDSTTRRRPDAKMQDFLKMAQQAKTLK